MAAPVKAGKTLPAATISTTTPAFGRKTFFLVLILMSLTTSDSKPSDVESLLKFKQSINDSSGVLSSWDPSKLPCFGSQNNWVGLICSRGGNVYGIKLENMGLSGKIDVDSLLDLSRLRAVSVMHNNFGGSMPEIKKLRALKAVFLSYNYFEGKIDDNAFEGLKRLRKLHLAHNKFSGEIPASLTGLGKLVELRLEENEFEGKIPEFKQTSFKEFNVSSNELEGPIPKGLAKIEPDAFAGNKALCGEPLNPCTPSTPDHQNSTPISSSSPRQHKSTAVVAAMIAAVVVAVAVAVLAILLTLRMKRPQKESNGAHPPSSFPLQVAVVSGRDRHDEGSHHNNGNARNKGGNGKLCFIREDRDTFSLPDLLRASAEILGSGCFGSSYKVNLTDGAMAVVKRFKKMNNVGREEFQEHMRRIGRLSHPNLLPLVAYYFRKEEKLLVSDFVQKGSLAGHLHGNHSRGQSTLNWPTRLKIIKGVARGLEYLHKELPALIAPHGHLKSSNVLLNESFEPILNDYALIPVINQESAQELMVAYKSPEYINTGRINRKTDVWALGILIIEAITGEFPANYLQSGADQGDLTGWVNAISEKCQSTSAIDENMGETATRNSEGEIRKLLGIGLACCESNVDERLDIKEACERIEEVKEREDDDDEEFESSRGLSEDFDDETKRRANMQSFSS
ncbi:hypothetical protein Nepgr_012568 [Nepenthes gracilis]|uniref:non-specific serine/threonine protein kinase n=1 Tax=Nepenthes gracilis TaxID=150966 RepID=A0AAD3SHJ0_NEPGR|nr:hypothetical protein Nepgr_012568 [Nepenthes gracilis]